MANSNIAFILAVSICLCTFAYAAPVNQDTLGDWPKNSSVSCDLQNVVTDVVFIWDGSGYLDETTSAIIYEYILAFLKPFKYGLNAVQAAMVTYENKVTKKIRFNQASTYDEFKSLLDKRGPPQGNGAKAGVDDAFRITLDEILTEKYGSRREVPCLVVFFPTQHHTGPDPKPRAAQLRQLAELFVVSLDSPQKMSDEELLAIAGDRAHIFQYNDVNVQDALPGTLPLATWRAICDAVMQTFTVSFTDDSTDFKTEFNVDGSPEQKRKAEEYFTKLSSVYQHSALHTAVIDIINFQRTNTGRTRVLTKTTFAGFTGDLEEKAIEAATEYLASKESWRELKATRFMKR